MKSFILTEAQLKEYVDRKKSEKTYYDILESIYNNMKFLKENVSLKKANQSVIDDFKRKNLINDKVYESLVRNKIIDKNYEIL